MAQVEGKLTDAQLDGWPRTMTYINVAGNDVLETISVTRDWVIDGAVVPKTYIKTFGYDGSGNVTSISEWVLQP